jgi:hypothetical protein
MAIIGKWTEMCAGIAERLAFLRRRLGDVAVTASGNNGRHPAGSQMWMCISRHIWRILNWTGNWGGTRGSTPRSGQGRL